MLPGKDALLDRSDCACTWRAAAGLGQGGDCGAWNATSVQPSHSSGCDCGVSRVCVPEVSVWHLGAGGGDQEEGLALSG